MEKVKKAKRLFVFIIVLIDWMIGFAFPLLVYASEYGAWGAQAKLRDVLDIILVVPLAAVIGPAIVGFVYFMLYIVLRANDRCIRLIPFDNSLKFNAFLYLTSPIWTVIIVCEEMIPKPITNIHLVSIIIILLIYIGLALWNPLEVQWVLKAIDRFERKSPDLVNYYSLRSHMEDDLEVYLQIKCTGISPDEFVMQEIEEMQRREKP